MHRARFLLRLSIVAALAGALPAAAGAPAPKPPANAAATETVVQPASSVSAIFGEAALRKGKKGRILRVNVATQFAATNMSDVAGSVHSVEVNGTFLTLPYPNVHSCSAAITLCAVSFTLWLDLDAAEAASPGTFVGEPLAVQVDGAMSFDGGAVGTATTRIFLELVKK